MVSITIQDPYTYLLKHDVKWKNMSKESYSGEGRGRFQFIFCTLLVINFLYLGCKIKLNAAARAQKGNCFEHPDRLRMGGSMLNINDKLGLSCAKLSTA